MRKVPAKPSSGPIVSRWHPGPVGGALLDAEPDRHSGKEVLGWIKRGIDSIVLDHDVTRVFLAHRKASRTEVIDPIGERERTAP